MSSLRQQAETWIENDPDPETRAELQAILAEGDEAELAERFAGPLAFGTAGLRGILGAGESRMNRAVVLRTSHGLGNCLMELDHQAGEERGVVIGYDGRRGSRQFAEDTAAALCAIGIMARLTTDVCPTPLLAFAVTHYGAVAGVMVTASHNPPQYNGYKVYAANGAQIIPPLDGMIAQHVDGAPAAVHVPTMDLGEAREQGMLHDVGPEVEALYLERIAGLSLAKDDAGRGDRDLPLVYTPMHGVGRKLAEAALAAAGFGAVHTVAEQAEPDGEFPTVAFPNPEEPGALDLALALAEQHQAALILANDPDADRLAAVVRDAAGAYVPLTGNEIGVLLGHDLLTRGPQDERRVVMASIVSSPQLGAIAEALGVRYEETLTGFKWIANRGLELEAEGYRFVFGYEEALGYTAGDVVRDKDGISAALLLAELAALRRAEGKTLLDELEGIARRYGLYVSGQQSQVFPGREGPAQMAKIMDGLRADAPDAIGGLTVLARRDYQAGTRVDRDGKETALTLPTSNVLTFELEGGSRIIARPSGTEPKIKFYVDLRAELGEGESFAAAKARAHGELEALRDAFTALATGGAA